MPVEESSDQAVLDCPVVGRFSDGLHIATERCLLTRTVETEKKFERCSVIEEAWSLSTLGGTEFPLVPDQDYVTVRKHLRFPPTGVASVSTDPAALALVEVHADCPAPSAGWIKIDTGDRHA